MCNRYSHIVLDTNIRDNYNWIEIRQNIENNVIEFTKVSSLTFFVFVICSVKGKITKKIIN